MVANDPVSHIRFFYPYLFFGSIFLIIVITLAINIKRLNFTWPHLLLPTIYLLATFSSFALIGSAPLRLFFVTVAAIVFYFVENKLGKESHFLQNVYLLCTFALYLGLFAVIFYFNFQIWWLILFGFGLSYILAVQGLAGFTLPAKKYFYFLIALVCTEIIWGLSFWPTHFFVNAVVVFCAFYLLWLFSFSAFFAKLSWHKVFWQVTLVLIVLFLTLSTAAWRPLR